MPSRCSSNDCTRCPSLVESRSRIVSGYGNSNATIMVVGLAPGRSGADITGVPFTRDSSGILFQKALIKAGLSKEKDPKAEFPELEIYITNLVKCNPRDLKGRNRNPTLDEISNCLDYLREEIDSVGPSLILAVGDIAFRTLLRLAAEKRVSSSGGVRIAHVYHPAFAIRGGAGKLKKTDYVDYFCSVIYDLSNSGIASNKYKSNGEKNGSNS